MADPEPDDVPVDPAAIGSHTVPSELTSRSDTSKAFTGMPIADASDGAFRGRLQGCVAVVRSVE